MKRIRLSGRKTMPCLRLLTIAGLSLLLTGCWNRVEVNDLAIVLAAAVDKAEKNQIELTLQVMVPISATSDSGTMEEGGKSAGHTLVRSAKGTTIADAMAKLQELLPRKVFWGHTEILLFGQELAKEGLQQYIDFIARHPQPRLRTYLFISKGKAAKALDLYPPLEKSSAEALRELTISKVMMMTTLKDFLEMQVGDSGAAVIPWVEILSSHDPKEPKQTLPVIQGSAILKRGKMIGRIDDRSTRGIMWLRNEVNAAIITIQPKETKGYMSFEIIRSTTRLIPQIRDGRWKMTVQIETWDDVVHNSTVMSVMNPKLVKSLESQLEEDLRRRIRSALTQVHGKMNADIFDFASAFHRKYPREWKRVKDHWDTVFADLEVEIAATVKIKRPGLSTMPEGVPKEEVIKR